MLPFLPSHSHTYFPSHPSPTLCFTPFPFLFPLLFPPFPTPPSLLFSSLFHLLNVARGSGERCKLGQRIRRSPAAKRLLCISRLTLRTFCHLHNSKLNEADFTSVSLTARNVYPVCKMLSFLMIAWKLNQTPRCKIGSFYCCKKNHQESNVCGGVAPQAFGCGDDCPHRPMEPAPMSPVMRFMRTDHSN